MRLYTFFTTSHAPFKDQFFLPSLTNEFELVVVAGRQSSDAAYMEQGWNSLMAQKVDVILRGIEENPGQPFVFSDVDVQFFRPAAAELARQVEGRDMAIQRDSPDGGLCAGFFVCVGTDAARRLWTDIRRRVDTDLTADDQGHLNQILRHEPEARLGQAGRLWLKLRNRMVGVDRATPTLRNVHQVQWSYLPATFLNGGTLSRQVWEPGMPVELPPGIFIHHANWTVGIPNKLALMAHVKSAMGRRS